MTRKRYRPEKILMRAIEGLESENEASQRRAVLSLLLHGPLLVTDETARLPQTETISVVRAELLAFLRAIVRGARAGEISSYSSMTFAARRDDESRVYCEARGEGRDLVILQVVTLVQLIGLENVRLCKVGDCQRMFVKTYRREFCSARCQKRAYMRQRRANAERNRARRRPK